MSKNEQKYSFDQKPSVLTHQYLALGKSASHWGTKTSGSGAFR
jgi:hypothetical protein